MGSKRHEELGGDRPDTEPGPPPAPAGLFSEAALTSQDPPESSQQPLDPTEVEWADDAEES